MFTYNISMKEVDVIFKCSQSQEQARYICFDKKCQKGQRVLCEGPKKCICFKTHADGKHLLSYQSVSSVQNEDIFEEFEKLHKILTISQEIFERKRKILEEQLRQVIKNMKIYFESVLDNVQENILKEINEYKDPNFDPPISKSNLETEILKIKEYQSFWIKNCDYDSLENFIKLFNKLKENIGESNFETFKKSEKNKMKSWELDETYTFPIYFAENYLENINDAFKKRNRFDFLPKTLRKTIKIDIKFFKFN